jgi:hypothetical protein
VRFQTADEMGAALAEGAIPGASGMPTEPLPVAAPTERLPRPADHPPTRRRLAPLLIALVALGLVGALAFALLSGEEPTRAGRAGRSPTPSEEPSPARSHSPSPTTPPPPAPNPVSAAVAALERLVAEGFQEGDIRGKAVEEIDKGVDEALEKFRDGDTEAAIKKLEDLVGKVDDLVENDEIAQSHEQRIVSAIEDIEEEMVSASPPQEEGDDD